jgi:ATP adenylyltransferase
MPLEYKNLFSLNKMGYIKGNRPKVECIFCSIIKKKDDVVKLLVYEGKHSVISVNKFPYNSGHILICPKRHIIDFREMKDTEVSEINTLLKKSLDILDRLYSPSGYNVGYNIGEFAGASLPHLHMHIIPRYRNELGFVDIVGGAKIVIQDPQETMTLLKKAFNKS